MAIIPCVACGKRIDVEAPRCPYCGDRHPLAPPPAVKTWFARFVAVASGLIAGLLVAFVVLPRRTELPSPPWAGVLRPAPVAATTPPASGEPPGRFYSAAVLLNGRLYVAGGFHSQGVARDLRVFDPRRGGWGPSRPLGSPFSFGVAAAHDGRIYIAGGCVNSDCRVGITRDLRIYDPASGAWTAGPLMLTLRTWTAGASDDHRLYLAGGMGPCPPCRPTDAFEAYDFAGKEWLRLSPMPSTRDHAAAAIVGRAFFVIGGYDLASGSQKIVNRVDAYELDNDRWLPRSPLLTPRGEAAAAAIGGKVYVAGGVGHDAGGNHVELSVLEVYDPARDSWKRRANMPEPASRLQAVAVDGKLELIGRVHLLYDPATDSWTRLPAIPND
ncbi:MAG: hypothetical protein NTX64_13570 [Elusimicrobia bacterium]|nr:hypothetical protein [Elusimicrobiota bacterium]